MYFIEIASASEQTPYCGVHASFKITLSSQRTWHVNECYFRLTSANLLSLSYLFSGECAGDSFRSWILKNHSFIYLTDFTTFARSNGTSTKHTCASENERFVLNVMESR